MPHRLYGYHTRGFMYAVVSHTSGVVKIGFSLSPEYRAHLMRKKVGPNAYLAATMRCSWGMKSGSIRLCVHLHLPDIGGEFYPLDVLGRGEVPEELRRKARSRAQQEAA